MSNHAGLQSCDDLLLAGVWSVAQPVHDHAEEAVHDGAVSSPDVVQFPWGNL